MYLVRKLGRLESALRLDAQRWEASGALAFGLGSLVYLLTASLTLAKNYDPAGMYFDVAAPALDVLSALCYLTGALLQRRQRNAAQIASVVFFLAGSLSYLAQAALYAADQQQYERRMGYYNIDAQSSALLLVSAVLQARGTLSQV